MADNNELKIKVSIDKVTLENVKSENRKLVAQIKADAQKSVKELDVLAKLELQQSKNVNAQIIADKKLNYQKDKDAYRQLQTEKRNLEKQANEQSKRDAEMLRRVQERQLKSSFPNNRRGAGFMMSAEVGENLATIGMGMVTAFNVARQLTSQLWEMSKAGAGFQVLRNHFESVSGSIQKANTDLDLLRTAVSGNLNDEQIIMFVNRMRELGLTTEQSAQILDIAERYTDKFGGTIEDAQQKVFRFIETGRGKGFEEMGMNIETVKKKTEELVIASGKTMETIDAEELATIRLKVALGEWGQSIDVIKNKTPELDDKLISSQKNVENLKLSFGILLAEGLEPTITGVGKLANVFTGASSSMKPVDDMLKKITSGLVGTKDIINTLTSPVSTLINLLTVKLPSAINILTDSFSKITSSLSMIAPTNFLSSVFSMVSNLINKVRELLGWMNKIPGMNINTNQEAMGGTSTYKDAMSGTITNEKRGGTSNRGSSSDKVIEEKAILNAYQQQVEVINKIKEALTLNVGLVGEEIRLKKELLDAEFKLYEIKFGSIKAIENRNIGNALGNYLPMQEDIRSGYQQTQNPFIQSKDFEVVIEQMVKPLNEAFAESFSRVKDVFSNIIDVFDLGTDTFLSKLINGFDRVLSIVNLITSAFEAVNAVKGFLGLASSFIPGGGAISAIGGLSGGGSMPMPMPMMSNSRPIINVQVQSEVESVKAVRFFENNFNSYQNAMRDSSF